MIRFTVGRKVVLYVTKGASDDLPIPIPHTAKVAARLEYLDVEAEFAESIEHGDATHAGSDDQHIAVRDGAHVCIGGCRHVGGSIDRAGSGGRMIHLLSVGYTDRSQMIRQSFTWFGSRAGFISSYL